MHAFIMRMYRIRREKIQEGYKVVDQPPMFSSLHREALQNIYVFIPILHNVLNGVVSYLMSMISYLLRNSNGCVDSTVSSIILQYQGLYDKCKCVTHV